MAKRYFVVEDPPGFEGPFELTADEVDRIEDEPGVYLLCDVDANGRLFVRYVGRAVALGRRLRQHVGNFDHFFVKGTETEYGAFFTECRLFHQYGKANNLDNRIHPAVPAGSGLPPCSERGCTGQAY